MFSRSRKSIAAFAALGMASVALLSACGDGDTAATDPAEPADTTAVETPAEPTTAETTPADEGTEPADDPGATVDLSGSNLNVVAAWSGAEQENFEAVLAQFEEDTGATVTYTSFGDNGPTYISGQLEGGTPPNVAVIGQPALMQQLATDGHLQPLNDEVKSAVEANYSQSWLDLGSVDGELYGVWFKAANKSTMWYNGDLWDEAGADAAAAEDWDGFLEQLGLIRDAGYAGISIGADVGWPLTDWFENVYLRTAGPEMYDQLTNHEIPWTDPSVTEALEILATLWGTDMVRRRERAVLRLPVDQRLRPRSGRWRRRRHPVHRRRGHQRPHGVPRLARVGRHLGAQRWPDLAEQRGRHLAVPRRHLPTDR